MAGLFVPFTPKGRAIEMKAIDIKRAFRYGPYEPVNPRELADRMGVFIVPDGPGAQRRSLSISACASY